MEGPSAVDEPAAVEEPVVVEESAVEVLMVERIPAIR